MGVGGCDSRPVRCAAVQGVGKGSRAARGRLQLAGTRQLSMGICDSRPFGRSAFCSAGEGGQAATGRLQHAGAGQHGMGICEGGPVGCIAVSGVGEVIVTSYRDLSIGTSSSGSTLKS